MKKLLNEWRDYMNEEIYGNRAVVYHGTDSLKDVEMILTEGYSLEKNTSAMYGRGIYTVYELEGTNTGSGHYGPMVIKFAVDMSGKHLILDYDQAKKVHGDDYRFEDQLRKFGLLDDLENTTRQDKTVVGPGTIIEKDRKNKTIIIKVIDVGIINQDEIPQSDKITNYINQKRKRELSPIALENIWVHYQMTDGFGRPIFNNSETTQFIAGYNDFYYNFVSPKDTKLIKDEPITLEKVPYKNTKSLNDAKRLVDYIYDEEGNLKYDNAYTSDIAKKVHNILSSKDNKITEIDSITFTGRNDGPVMVIYNPEKAKMLSWKKIRVGNRLQEGDIVEIDEQYVNLKAAELQYALNHKDVDVFYSILKDAGIRRDSEDVLSLMDTESDLHKAFTAVLKKMKGKIIGYEENTGLYKVDFKFEGVGRYQSDELVIVKKAKENEKWVKDVNGKKILNYIEGLKKQKKPNLPE